MSTEPAGTNGNFKKVKRTNLNLNKKDWCIYTSECKEHLDKDSHLCYYCVYRIPLDIPMMLEDKKKKNGN